VQQKERPPLAVHVAHARARIRQSEPRGDDAELLLELAGLYLRAQIEAKRGIISLEDANKILAEVEARAAMK
jgi:hypothetical protein